MSHYPPPSGVSRPPPPSHHPPPPQSSLPPRPPLGESYRPVSGATGNGSGRDRDRDREQRGGSGGRNRNRGRNRGRNNGDVNGHDTRNRGSNFTYGASQASAPPRGDFTFRAEKPAGVYEAQRRGDHYAPPQLRNGGGRPVNDRRHGGGRYGGRDRNGEGGGGRRSGSGGGGYQGNFANRRFLAANRPILHQTQGCNSVTQNFVKDNEGTTYLNLDDLSDSDEAEMDLSSSEDSDGGEGKGNAPPRKRARVGAKTDAAQPPAVPKWSNPDPYTVLPPIEIQGGAKKKDVVHLIRKARVKAERAAVTSAHTEDFISCDINSDEDESEYYSGDSSEDDYDEEKDEGEDTQSEDEGKEDGSPSGPGSGTNGRMQAKRGRRGGERDTQANGKSNICGGAGAATGSQSLTLLPNRPNGPNWSPADAASSAAASSSSLLAPPSGPRNKKGKLIHLAGSPTLNPARKRTHDDELKPLILPDHAALKRTSKMPVGGVVVVGWRVKAYEPPCPWVQDHSDTAHMGVWLHKEIVDFHNYIKPLQYEQELRQALLDNLNHSVRRRFPNSRIHCFGSFMSGLYLPTGDMDIVMCSTQFLNNGAAVFNKKGHLFKFSGYISSNNIAEPGHVQQITHAKVPLVKYIDKHTGLKVDVSFENTNGIVANDTFAQWKKMYPEMPILVTLLKQFLMMRGLNEPVNGGIGGFSVICLVVSMLQLMPPLQTGDVVGRSHLGDLLMHFFDLYGNKFNYDAIAISLDPPGYVPKNKVRRFTYKNTDRLSIIDPNNPDNDISGGSKNTSAIMRVFSDAFYALQHRMMELSKMPPAHRTNQSILSVILEGDYSVYRNQREYLRDVYLRTFNRPPAE